MKPMKAARVIQTADEYEKNSYFPVQVSPKLDGYRCIVTDPQRVPNTYKSRVAWSYNEKPFPNLYVQQVLKDVQEIVGQGMDGELCSGDTFQSSARVTRINPELEPFDFTYYVFDDWSKPELPYSQRLLLLAQKLRVLKDYPDLAKHVKMVPFTWAHDQKQLESAASALATVEGCMLHQDVDEEYLFGKKSKHLIKIKPMAQDEAIIVGFNPEYYGTDLKSTDESLWGQPKNRVGSLQVTGVPGSRFENVTWSVGTGISHEQRKEMFDNWQQYEGKVITFRYVASGTVDKPRMPVFAGLRWDYDLPGVTDTDIAL